MHLTARLLAATLVLGAASAQAQNAVPGATYKVEFNIRDAADAAKGARHYTMLIDPGERGIFKVGDRVPVITKGSETTYVDVGVNIEARLREVNGRVLLNSNIDMSTARPGGATPTIAQVRVDVNTTVTPGKPTLVAVIDDPASDHKLDVQATVTKLD